MKYSVMWSGGFDSTYMIQYLLDANKDNTVEACYLQIDNNELKTKKEFEAIEKLTPILNKIYGNRFLYKGVSVKVLIQISNHSVYCPQSYFLLTALAQCTYKDHDYACLGYVMNDCSISFLDEIKGVWENFSKMRTSPLPPLNFPLSKYPKYGINSNLRPELKDLCTCCESDLASEKFCFECSPCKRNEEAGLIHKPVFQRTIQPDEEYCI